MMQAYRTEGNYRSAARLSAAELRAAMASHEILQATALAFDTQRQLRFDLGGVRAVSVYIKNILPEKMKIKLVIVNHSLNQRHRFELRYFITEGHLDRWVYSTPGSSKRIETDFAAAACNPA